MAPKKFFLVGGYAYSNPGDIAILKATVERLAVLHPGSHFVVLSNKADFSVSFGSAVSSELVFHRCPWFFAGNRVLPRAFLYLYRLLYPFSQTLAQKIWARQNAPVVRKMRESDFILFVGGGYINSNYAYELFQMHHLACLARESGKPVYLLGQTLGPFKNKWHLAVAQTIFRAAERIVLREPYSIPELGEFSSKAAEGADEALDFKSPVEASEEKRLLPLFDRPDALTVLLGLSLKASKPPADYSKLVQNLNEFNLKFAGGRLKVLFVFMETSRYDDDRREAALFQAVPGRNFKFSILPEPMSVEGRRWAVSKTDLFLGMRFHSLVFALASGVPCAGLYSGQYYFRKNYGLLEMYGMERRCFQMDALDGLADTLGELLEKRAGIRSTLQKKQAEISQRQADLYRALFQA